MSLPRKKGCCLASVHMLSLNPMEVITSNRACHTYLIVVLGGHHPGEPTPQGYPFPPPCLQLPCGGKLQDLCFMLSVAKGLYP